MTQEQFTPYHKLAIYFIRDALDDFALKRVKDKRLAAARTFMFLCAPACRDLLQRHRCFSESVRNKLVELYRRNQFVEAAHFWEKLFDDKFPVNGS